MIIVLKQVIFQNEKMFSDTMIDFPDTNHICQRVVKLFRKIIFLNETTIFLNKTMILAARIELTNFPARSLFAILTCNYWRGIAFRCST